MSKELDRIDALRERINESNRISNADREALITFSEEMEFLDTRYSNLRHIKLLRHCTILAGDSEKYSPNELPDCDLSTLSTTMLPSRKLAAGSNAISIARRRNATTAWPSGCSASIRPTA